MGQIYGVSTILSAFPSCSLIWWSLTVGDLGEDNTIKRRTKFIFPLSLVWKLRVSAQGFSMSQLRLLTPDASESHALCTCSVKSWAINEWASVEFTGLPITRLIGILIFLFVCFYVSELPCFWQARMDSIFEIWAWGNYLPVNTYLAPSPSLKKSCESKMCLSSPTHLHTYANLRN